MQFIKTSLIDFFMPLVYLTAWLLEKMGRVKMIGRTENGQYKLYLKRFYVLRTERFRIYLHQFWASDPDEHLHQHPFNFGNLILTNGYDEAMLDGIHTRKPGYFKLWRRANEFHRILLAPGTESKVWTLFWRGKKFQPWGFLVDGRLIDHEMYFDDKVTISDGG